MNSSTSPEPTSTEPCRWCRCCGEPCATISQIDYRKGATGPIILSTCVEPSCELFQQTLSDSANLSMYHAVASYDGKTGALLPAYMRCSNVGKDTPRSRWERRIVSVGRAANNR